MERRVAFYSLPNELFSLLLTDWLRWEDVVRCDSAMCNKAERADWLGLLKNGCIFHSVAIGGWNANVVSRWLQLRCIRTTEIDVSNFIAYDKASMESWLIETSPFIESAKLERIPKALLKCIKRHCTRLTALRMTFQQPHDDLCWDIIQNNPLVELHIHSVPGGEDIYVPHELSLPLLRKLNFDAERVLNIEIFSLLEKLPLLQRLRIVSPSQEYAVLAESCPNLLYLDLSNALQQHQGDIREIANFLRWLKVGLRCLVLPRNSRLSPEGNQAIVEHHAHSLHCLCFPSAAKKTRFPFDNDVDNLVHHLPTLHTLQVSCFDLSTLKPIANPSITHLLVDFCYSNSEQMHELLLSQCPTLIKLSLCRLKGSVAAVAACILELLLERPLIDTICVDTDELMAHLMVRLPNIKVRRYCAVDIFSQEY